jgi:hypothetical protein
MVSLAAYKIALIVVLAGVPTSFGASAYYYQQQSTTLNNHLSSLTTQLNTTNNDLAGLKNQLTSANSQISSLSNQIASLNGKLSQLQSLNSQLQSQLNLLQSQLTGHNQLQVSTVSQGQVSLSSNNGFQQVGFSVPPNAVERLNITFSTASQGCLGALPITAPCSLGVSLFNQTQFAKFSKCNCIQYGNYTTSTWSSPIATSYTTQIVITSSGAWTLAFYPEPGTSSTLMIQVNESVLLIGPLNLTTQVTQISNGSLSVAGYTGIQFVSFNAPPGGISYSINLTFSAGGGSVRVALLNQAQYMGFVNCNCVPYGNYTSATWMAPLATSYTAPVTIPASGIWYLAFFEPPGTSNPLSISETVKLIILTT